MGPASLYNSYNLAANLCIVHKRTHPARLQWEHDNILMVYMPWNLFYAILRYVS